MFIAGLHQQILNYWELMLTWHAGVPQIGTLLRMLLKRVDRQRERYDNSLFKRLKKIRLIQIKKSITSSKVKI